MPVGTVDTFTQTCEEICTDALINVGAVDPGRTAAGAMLTHARRALNRLVKSIDADGQFTWRLVRRTQVTTDGDKDFTTGTDVLDIDEPMSFIRAGATSRSPIYAMSRDDYMHITDRTSEAVPSRFLVEKTLSGITVTLWPVPDATGDTIEYAAYLRALDYDSGATHSDFPTKWIAALVYGLSAELAPAYSQPQLVTVFRPLFQAERQKQLMDDTERGGLTLVPFGGY